MDFHVNYYFERNCKVYVNLTYRGRNYDRLCKLDGHSHPRFRFRGKIWQPDCTLQMSYEL